MSSSIERDAVKAQIMTGDARWLIRAGVSEATAVEIALLSAPTFEDEPWLFWDSLTEMFLTEDGWAEAQAFNLLF